MSGTIGIPVCTIDATGIHAPSYASILQYLQAQFQSIYGSDIYLGNDSQDGQMLAVFAAAINDTNAMAVSAFNAFSPATAQGTGLSSVVKINGIARDVPTSSTVDLLLTGQVGTTIRNGAATDVANQQWTLPRVVVIPGSGQVTVTAISAQPGAITAGAGTVTTIATPTRGWQTVTNPLAAVPGQPVESDGALRQRQTVSTAIPSLTVIDGLRGAIAALLGVGRYDIVENDTSSTDVNGIPSHSFSVIVEGGDAQTIANTILLKKGPGAGTYGTTSETSVDSAGVNHTISFYRPTEVVIDAVVTLHNLVGYSSIIGLQVQAAVATYIGSLGIGDDVLYTRLYGPANLPAPAGDTYDLTSITIARHGNSQAAANLTLAFNEVASVGTITITVA